MRFLSLTLAAFRNLKDGRVETAAKDIFLVGENGQGKTNFLEALYFCSYAASFRGAPDGALVAAGSEPASCAAAAEVENAVLTRHIAVKIENGVKSAALDGKKIDDRKTLLSLAPTIVFCHDDMAFVAGSPERRRWFFDQNRSLYDAGYLDALRRYRKVLKTRNTVLKELQGAGRYDTGREDVLDALDPQLAEYGCLLMEKRRHEAEQFSAIFEPVYEKVAGIDGIRVDYRPSWKDAAPGDVREKLLAGRRRDLQFGTTLSGPHRDRYEFIRKKKDFTGTASTGQLRLLTLLLRVSQTMRYTAETGNCPALLLDDVLLELDGEKKRRFLSVMPRYDQAFFTFLPDESFARYNRDDAMTYDVSGGQLTLRIL